MCRAHPPSVYRTKLGVTEGGNGCKGHFPRRTEPYRIEFVLAPRCHPRFDRGEKH